MLPAIPAKYFLKYFFTLFRVRHQPKAAANIKAFLKMTRETKKNNINSQL